MKSVGRMFGTPIPWMVALNVMGLNLIAPVLPAYAAHFGVGFAAASTLVTAYALARMASRLGSGSLADRHGSRSVCAGGGVVQAGGALLAAFAPGLGTLLAARAVQGVGSALFGTSINRYLLVETEPEELGRATAGLQAGILMGATIGPIIGGVVADRFGVFAPFYVQAVVATALAVVSLSFIRDTGHRPAELSPRSKRSRSVRALLGLSGFKVVMLLGFAHFFVRAGGLNVLVPAFANDVLTMSSAEIGAIIAISSVASFFVMPFAGHVADTLGRVPVAMLGTLATACTLLLYGVFDTRMGLTVISTLVGLSIGLAAVALPTMVGDIAPAGMEGRASGVYRMANDFGWILGPTILGFMADGGSYTVAFLVAALPLLLGAIVLARSPALRTAAALPPKR